MRIGPPRVALIVMPWFNIENPPLGVAVLKSYLESRGIRADCFHFNLLLAGRIGTALMLNMRDMVWPGWFFSYHLFGPGGTGELRETLPELLADEGFQRFMARSPGATPERLEKLLNEDVPAFLDDCLAAAAWEDYDVIGFSSIMCSHVASLALAKKLKERYPDKTIVFGGPNVEGPMGPATLEACDWVDCFVDGEGERALAALVENARAGKPDEPIPKVSFQRGGKASARPSPARPPLDMNELGIPNHDDYFRQLERYAPVAARSLRREATFEASRGCWWGEKQHCTFCGIPGTTINFRAKSAEAVARDIVELHRRHKVRRLVATDDIIALDHIKTLMPLLARIRREKRLDWEIFFETKSNLTGEQLRSLSEAGVFEIQPGIESLSTPILKLMRKGVRAIQNIQTLKLGRLHGLWVNWLWIYGFPGEDPAEYERMADLVPALTHLPPPTSVNRIRVERFSPYHENPAGFGIAIEPYAEYRRCFPPERFAIDDMAYSFSYRMPPGSADPDAYAAPVVEAGRLWDRRCRSSFLAYKRGRDFLELYDCRPAGRRQSSSEYRHEVVDGLDAFLLDLCETIRTSTGIEEACRRRDPGLTRARVDDALQGLVAKRWLIREDDSYLSLALPVSALLPPQAVALEGLMQTQKELFLQRGAAPPKPARSPARRFVLK
ncbi:MAG: RiPP maturation radical SAM C-methyltransferase [Elusimicrobiota bacterium]